MFSGVCAKYWDGLIPTSSQAATQLLAHPPPQWDGGENRKNKSNKTYGSRYRQLNGGRKGGKKNKPTSEVKKIAHHIPQVDQCPTTLRTTDTLEAKNIPFFFLYLFLFLTMTAHSMEYPFGQFGSAVPAVFPPNLLPTPSLLSGQAG